MESCQECDADDTECCAICLHAIARHGAKQLLCGHGFCRPCLRSLVTHKYREIITSDVHYHRKLAVSWLRSCTCPTCRVRLDTRMIKDLVEGVGSFVSDHTIEMLKALDLGSRHANDPEVEAVEEEEGPIALGSNIVLDRAEVQRTNAYFRLHHVKLCPSCSSPIEKNGGCPSMRCFSCSTSFRWTDVPLACPCKGFHTKWKHKCLPLAQWCEHVPKVGRHHVSLRAHAAYYAQNGCVLALPMALASPVLALVATVWVPHRVIVRPVREAYQAWNQRAEARRRLRSATARAAIFHQESECTLQSRLACRRGEAPHDLVAGWCQNCGVSLTRSTP